MSNTEFDSGENTQQFADTLPTKTNAQVSAALQALELEEKQLDLELKREKVNQIRAKRQAQLDENRAKQLATRQFLAQREAIQANCNHQQIGVLAA